MYRFNPHTYRLFRVSSIALQSYDRPCGAKVPEERRVDDGEYRRKVGTTTCSGHARAPPASESSGSAEGSVHYAVHDRGAGRKSRERSTEGTTVDE